MTSKTPPAHHTALKLALETAGGYEKLAKICGCKRQHLHNAYRAGRGLPAKYAVNVEKGLGISRHVTRPDIFGPLPKEATS